MFSVLCCAEVCGTRANLEVGFPALPTIGEFRRRVEETFRVEQRLSTPAQLSAAPVRPFRVGRLQIYDEVLAKWVDLISSTQLHEFDQVYVFEPHSMWQLEEQKDLPPPRPPLRQPGSPPAPPRSVPDLSTPAAVCSPPGAQAAPSRLPPGWAPATARSEKAQQVLEELDVAGRGFLEYGDFELGLQQRGLDLAVSTIGEIYDKADLNCDGKVCPEEWHRWAAVFPNILESLWFHSRDCVEELTVRRRVDELDAQMRGNAQRKEQLLRELAALEAADAGLAQQRQQARETAADAARRRVQLSQEERDLIEEEIKMERQRDHMRAQESRFRQVSDKFNRDAATKGSPRRAREHSGSFSDHI
eukprot:TRINITY_DN33834_c0_g1_i1.p1 TRINITY_DN33834_c0_g1~~TRINITY_DN33834_c0_g1_i1.p1  ORF type:complete len:360 (+),score=148.52 TRINITY_DN33834_c0_g1_i1:67-1146(+)